MGRFPKPESIKRQHTHITLRHIKKSNNTNRIAPKCYICGKILQIKYVNKHDTFTFDHVVPKSKGGKYIKPACLECNQRKKDMDLMTVKKGTVIKIGGIPFELANDTLILGEKTNFNLAKDFIDGELNQSICRCQCTTVCGASVETPTKES